MDVHDAGPGGAPLAPGMVFTDEPGLYFPDEALGFRIEDDVLVTATGHEVLSAGAPKTVAEIERLMRRTAAPKRRPGREE
jgi:Xaa-Pro aminopeptidase